MKRRGSMRYGAAWAMGLCLAWSGAAMAGGFTEGGAALWSARAERFVQAFRDDRPGVNTQEALGRACDGLYGEMFRYGMYKTQVPNYASDAFRRLCNGIDALNGKAHGRQKLCNELEGARKQFAKIKAGEAPENVVALSERFLVPMIDSLLAKGKQDDWSGC